MRQFSVRCPHQKTWNGVCMGSRDKSRLSAHAVFQQLIRSSDSDSHSFFIPAHGAEVELVSVSLCWGTASLASVRWLWLFVCPSLELCVVWNDKLPQSFSWIFVPCLVEVSWMWARIISIFMHSARVEVESNSLKTLWPSVLFFFILQNISTYLFWT